MATHVSFDINISIDFLNRTQEARELFARYDELVISEMVYMEVMVGLDLGDALAVHEAEDMMTMFEILGIDHIAMLAIEVRRETKSKFPDAIIHATALDQGIPLISRNRQDFKPVSFMRNIDVLVPY